MLVPAEERRQEDAVGDEHEKGKAQWVRLPLTAEIEAPVSLSWFLNFTHKGITFATSLSSYNLLAPTPSAW